MCYKRDNLINRLIIFYEIVSSPSILIKKHYSINLSEKIFPGCNICCSTSLSFLVNQTYPTTSQVVSDTISLAEV